MSTGSITARGRGRSWGRGPARPGFTLIELLAVIVIIAILLSLILVAAMDAQRRAEERATQSLIAKLDGGIADRLDALLQSQPSANYAHGYLAAIYVGANTVPPILTPTGQLNSQLRTSLRAQTIAAYDYIKSEMPDVFSIDPNFTPGSSYTGPYPFNFAGSPFPGTPLTPLGNNMLPLGHMVMNSPPQSYGDSTITGGILTSTFPNLGLTGSGIYGASYNAAAGLYRNLGYLPTGYDGVDNGGIAGLVDDWGEGVNSSNQAQVLTNLGNHLHKTARAEMLYAILVEGSGPWGSVFSKDQFTDREVRDTDGDGLPEFIDAWGQPLQFFRWPLFYHSGFQIGMNIVGSGGSAWSLVAPYTSMWQVREHDGLDPTNQLMAPAWWSTTGVGGLAANQNSPFGSLFPAVASPPPYISGGALGFASFFHTLAEPLQAPVAAGFGMGVFWDPAATLRRAYYTKPLILSGGLDQTPGVFLYSDAYLHALGQKTSLGLIANENSALPFGLDLIDFTVTGGISWNYNSPVVISASASSIDPNNPMSFDIQQSSQDDITNHNLSTTVGVGGSN